MTSLARSHERLRHLYDISTLLTRFEGAHRTLPEVVAVAARALPVRTAVLVLEEGGALHSHVWKRDDLDEGASDVAVARAREAYAWFTGSAAQADEGTAPPSRRTLPVRAAAAAVGAASTDARFIVSPLVVARGRVFGLLQIEGVGPLDEGDLFFINSAGCQLAVAIDRQASIDDAEARVRAQLDFTRTLTTSLGEGVLATDIDARITFVNPAAEELLGWTEASILGTLAPDVLRVQGPDGVMLEQPECPLVRALESHTRIASDDHAFLGRDGVAVPVSYTASPLRSSGSLRGAVMVFRDVLEVKRSERMQRLLASVSAALGESLDYETTLGTLSRCAIPSFADVCFIDEVEEGRPSEPTPDAPSADGLTAQARALHTGSPVVVEHVGDEALRQLAAGDVASAHRWSGVRSVVVVPLAVRGRAFGVVSFGMAQSGRRFTAEDLPLAEELGHRAAIAIDNARLHRATERALRDRQDILAVVSHDLRSPLSTVLLAASNLLERRSEPAGVADDRPLLAMIGRAANRMERMIKDLLDVSSIEVGHLAVVAVPTAVAAIIDDLLEAMAQPAAAGSVELVARPVDPLLLVRCDRDRILQVLSNIVGNAIKFTPAGGRVELSTELSDELVRFAVADNGPGIAEELVPHLFERYRQAAETASRGRGLGLFIAKGIVEAHGGSIGVDTALGRGAAFSFALPRAAPAPS